MRIKKETISDIAFFLFVFYNVFAGLIHEVLGFKLLLVLWALILVFAYASMPSPRVLRKGVIVFMLILSFFVLFNNADLVNHGYLNTAKILMLMLFGIPAMQLKGSYKKAVKYLLILGFVHVIATYFFLLVPDAYKIMYQIWGEWPIGTEDGLYGYRAALSNHYSQNGTVLAFELLTLFGALLSEKNNSKKLNIWYFVMLILTFGAILLTTKRAHVLFGLIALAIVFILYKPEKISKRLLMTIAVAGVGATFVFFCSDKISVIQDLLSRFQNLDKDTNVQTRFRLWKAALEMFENKPIIGNGLFSFKHYYYENFYESVKYARIFDVHNVYLQLLAENGIIGFYLFLLFISRTIKKTIMSLHKNREFLREKCDYDCIIISFAYVVFIILYSFTGNCLYNICNGYLVIACIFAYGTY